MQQLKVERIVIILQNNMFLIYLAVSLKTKSVTKEGAKRSASKPSLHSLYMVIHNAPKASVFFHPINKEDKRNLLCMALGFSVWSASDIAALGQEKTFTVGPQSVSISWINIHQSQGLCISVCADLILAEWSNKCKLRIIFLSSFSLYISLTLAQTHMHTNVHSNIQTNLVNGKQQHLNIHS